MKQQPDNAVDMVFGSPPYAEKGQRYKGQRKNLNTDEWISWMIEVTKESVRISSGMVLWIVNGSVKNRRYLPACEGLIWEWYRQGGWSDRSCIWHKNSLPNRSDWFVNDWEFVLTFKKPNTKSKFNWKAIAQPSKRRSMQWFTHRDTNGRRKSLKKTMPKELTRPRDVIRVPVGGGLMGHPLAHETEAPFPLKLAKHFVLACSNSGDTVLDPFVGSGTTLHACLETERDGIGIDIRKSQIELTKRRLCEVAAPYKYLT